MTSARLRVTPVGGGEVVYGDVELHDDALVASEAVSPDGALEVGGVTVTLTAASFLGVAKKPLPAGRHRAVVERLVFDAGSGTITWTPVIDGTVSNERTAHGDTIGPTPADGPHAGALVRRWTVEVADSALADALALLEDAPVAGATTTVETGTATGLGVVEVRDVEWTPFLGGVVAGAAAVGVAVEGPTGGPPDDLFEYWTAAVACPHPDRDDARPSATCGELLDLWRAMRPLLVTAAYDPYPGFGLTVVVGPGPTSAEYAQSPVTAITLGAVDLDGGRAFADRAYEDSDRATEPAEIDGEVYDDFAVTWAGGPDGSRIQSGGVVDAPTRACYAAARTRLRGDKAPARDGGREVANAHVLELGARLVGHEGDSLVTEFDGDFLVTHGRPVVDIDSDVDAMYVVVLINAAGGWRSIAEFVETGETEPSHFLWCDRLFPELSGRYADREVLRPDPVPLARAGVTEFHTGPAVGTVAVVAQDEPWMLESREIDYDGGEVTMTLVRTEPLDPGALGEPDRREPAPAVRAVSDSALNPVVTVDAWVTPSAEVPTAIEVEHVSGEEGFVTGPTLVTLNPISPAGRHWRLTAENLGGGAGYAGSQWRARAVYPSGTVSAWTTATAADEDPSGAPTGPPTEDDASKPAPYVYATADHCDGVDGCEIVAIVPGTAEDPQGMEIEWAGTGIPPFDVTGTVVRHANRRKFTMFVDEDAPGGDGSTYVGSEWRARAVYSDRTSPWTEATAAAGTLPC